MWIPSTEPWEDQNKRVSLSDEIVPFSAVSVLVHNHTNRATKSNLFLWIHIRHRDFAFWTTSRFLVSGSIVSSHTDPCRYTDLTLPSSNVDQIVIRTNGDLFALPIAGPTGQLYVRPVKGSERYTFKSTKLKCHKWEVGVGSDLKVRGVVLRLRSVREVPSDDGSGGRRDARRCVWAECLLAVEGSSRGHRGGERGARAFSGRTSPEDPEHGVQSHRLRDSGHGIEVRHRARSDRVVMAPAAFGTCFPSERSFPSSCRAPSCRR